MPTTIENCPFQCAAGGEEQGCKQVLWQVLSTGVGLDIICSAQHGFSCSDA